MFHLKETESSAEFSGKKDKTLFIYLLFHSLVLRRVHFAYSNFAWGLPNGVGVKWSGGLLVLEPHRCDCG
jgi:hypothetical protein